MYYSKVLDDWTEIIISTHVKRSREMKNSSSFIILTLFVEIDFHMPRTLIDADQKEGERCPKKHVKSLCLFCCGGFLICGHYCGKMPTPLDPPKSQSLTRGENSEPFCLSQLPQ